MENGSWKVYTRRYGLSLPVTIAAPFRHTRKEQLKKNEIVYYLAFERGWMNIEQANLLLIRAKEEGLIAYEGDMIRLLFDVQSVEIPLGFKPSASVFRKSDPQEELLQRIAVEKSVPLTLIVAEMNAIITQEFDGNIRPEGAVIILAKRHGVECSDLLPALRENVLKK